MFVNFLTTTYYPHDFTNKMRNLSYIFHRFDGLLPNVLTPDSTATSGYDEFLFDSLK